VIIFSLATITTVVIFRLKLCRNREIVVVIFVIVA